MTYQELSEIGQLRKIYKCGPLSMFLKLADMWKDKTPTEVCEKCDRFNCHHSRLQRRLRDSLHHMPLTVIKPLLLHPLCFLRCILQMIIDLI